MSKNITGRFIDRYTPTECADSFDIYQTKEGFFAYHAKTKKFETSGDTLKEIKKDLEEIAKLTKDED